MKTLKTLVTFLMLSGLLFLAGCDDRVSTFDVKGPLARAQLGVFWTTVFVNVGLFIAVGGVLAYALWKFRERPGDENKPLPDQGHGHPAVEVGLIAASVGCLVIIAVPTLKAIWLMNEIESAFDYTEDREVLEINVRGYQWWWGFEYADYPFPGGDKVVTTGNELVIPVNKVVKLNLRSDNVIHSFWLPKVAGKTDLMPGRNNWMWILAEEEGHYYGECAEYCGEAHAYMYFRTDVVSQEEFDQWMNGMLAGASSPHGESWDDFYAAMETPAVTSDSVKNGARLFMGKGGCTQCHRIDGSQRAESGMLGPNLTNVGSRKTLAAGVLENRGGIDDNWRDTLMGDGHFKGMDEGQEYSTSTANIDADIQFANIYKWIKESHDVKPGNLMYRSIKRQWTDSDQALLKQGNLKPNQQIQLMQSGMMSNEVEALASEPLTAEDIQRGQAARLTDREFEDIARYLQTLRVELD